MSNDVLDLIGEVCSHGVTMRVDMPDIVIEPPGIVPAELKARVKARKPEVIQKLKELEESMKRLEAADVRLAVSEDGDMRIVYTENGARQAVLDGYAIYTPRDAYMYIQLDQRERKMLLDFRKRFGGTAEWR
jgi:hypothetical protein